MIFKEKHLGIKKVTSNCSRVCVILFFGNKKDGNINGGCTINEVTKYVRGEGGYLVMSDGSSVNVSPAEKTNYSNGFDNIFSKRLTKVTGSSLFRQSFFK